jgi:hypothetical protein
MHILETNAVCSLFVQIIAVQFAVCRVVKYPPLLLPVNAEEIEAATFVTSDIFCSAY